MSAKACKFPRTRKPELPSKSDKPTLRCVVQLKLSAHIVLIKCVLFFWNRWICEWYECMFCAGNFFQAVPVLTVMYLVTTNPIVSMRSEGDTRHADQRHLLEPHGGLRLSRGQRGLQCLLLRRQVSPSVDFLPLDHAWAVNPKHKSLSRI